MQNRRRIDTTKDRQEQAIFAFTIVTIIFLPLSAVSSIFGMNTKDVRDMEWGQGLYWAVAIPVTVVVIILGLLMTGQLGFIAEWVLRRASRRQKQGGYFTVDDASREVVQGPEYAARFWSADEVEVPRRRRTVSFA